jgi:glutamate-1-semialdehyde 2,1-aminomutase
MPPSLSTLKGTPAACAAASKPLVSGLQAAADAHGLPFCGDSEGGMFGFFLLPELPQNYPQVMTTKGAQFNQLFHGLLARGVYIAPALYEAGFVSAAHSDADIDHTIAAASEVFAELMAA